MFGNMGTGDGSKAMSTVHLEQIRNHACALKWLGIANLLVTFVTALLVLFALNGVMGEVKVIMKATDLTPEKIQEMSENTQAIVRNARTISANMVPVSEVTVQNLVNSTNSTGNVSFAQAATAALIGVGHADWNSVVGNGSLAMGSIAAINFSVVTGLFEQAQDPQTQSVIRRQIDKALATFDYASKGVSNVLTVFRDGIAAEEKLKE